MRHYKTLLLLLLLCCIAYFSCKKDDPPPQLVKGKVLDKKTGKPVPEAVVALRYENPDNDPLVDDRIKFTHTNYKGEFEYTDNSGWIFDYLSDVEADGYLRCSGSGCGIDIHGPADNIVAMITPLDGVLKIEAVNSKNTYGSIYIWLVYQTLVEASVGAVKSSPLHTYPVTQDSGSHFVEYRSLPSDEIIKLSWKFKPNPGVGDEVFADTVITHINDTTYYLIEY